ncbi:MAG: hypothetical protein A3I03_10230 [Candidatus Rokubacteria bacterium RIFCSPLOWO2_02_FULL_68_19]|nr:MAG: hypothetical protein A3I03_10230 [Candidatus Rokubacteria bacterium RIFCSPLOWO2_02_FULL_68_19]
MGPKPRKATTPQGPADRAQQTRADKFKDGGAVMNQAKNIEVIRRYFDGCNSSDLDVLLSTLAPDVVHYFLPHNTGPIKGAQHLARYWRKFKQVLDPIWAVDHIIAQGNEVVSEWSVVYSPAGTQPRIMQRGTEWYVMRDGRISEVRAYLILDEARNCELTGFPYSERGYLSGP